MLMDRRITIQFYRQVFHESQYGGEGLEETREIFNDGFREYTELALDTERRIWARRADDRITETTETERGLVVSRNVAQRTYVIRPWQYLKDFGNNAIEGVAGGFGNTRLVSEDNRVWWIRGLSEDGRNRLWRLEAEQVKLS